jgi:hypothetical protein
MAVFCFCDSAHAIPVKAITWGEEEEGAIGEPYGPESSETRSRKAVSRRAITGSKCESRELYWSQARSGCRPLCRFVGIYVREPRIGK